MSGGFLVLVTLALLGLVLPSAIAAHHYWKKSFGAKLWVSVAALILAFFGWVAADDPQLGDTESKWIVFFAIWLVGGTSIGALVLLRRALVNATRKHRP